MTATKFECTFDENKATFYRTSNAVLSKLEVKESFCSSAFNCNSSCSNIIDIRSGSLKTQQNRYGFYIASRVEDIYENVLDV